MEESVCFVLSCGETAPVRANVVAMKHTSNEPAKPAKQNKLAARSSRCESDGAPFKLFCRDNPIFELVPMEASSACGPHNWRPNNDPAHYTRLRSGKHAA